MGGLEGIALGLVALLVLHGLMGLALGPPPSAASGQVAGAKHTEHWTPTMITADSQVVIGTSGGWVARS